MGSLHPLHAALLAPGFIFLCFLLQACLSVLLSHSPSFCSPFSLQQPEWIWSLMFLWPCCFPTVCGCWVWSVTSPPRQQLKKVSCLMTKLVLCPVIFLTFINHFMSLGVILQNNSFVPCSLGAQGLMVLSDKDISVARNTFPYV